MNQIKSVSSFLVYTIKIESFCLLSWGIKVFMAFCDIKGLDQTSRIKGPELVPFRPCTQIFSLGNIIKLAWWKQNWTWSGLTINSEICKHSGTMGKKLLSSFAKWGSLHTSYLQCCCIVSFNVNHYYQWIIHVSNCFPTAEKIREIRNKMEIDTKYRPNPPRQVICFL